MEPWKKTNCYFLGNRKYNNKETLLYHKQSSGPTDPEFASCAWLRNCYYLNQLQGRIHKCQKFKNVATKHNVLFTIEVRLKQR